MSPYPLPFPWLLIAGLTVWNTVDYCWYNRQQNLALYLKVYKGKKRMSALTGAIVLNEIYAFRQVLSLIAKKKKKKKTEVWAALQHLFFFWFFMLLPERISRPAKKSSEMTSRISISSGTGGAGRSTCLLLSDRASRMARNWAAVQSNISVSRRSVVVRGHDSWVGKSTVSFVIAKPSYKKARFLSKQFSFRKKEHV